MTLLIAWSAPRRHRSSPTRRRGMSAGLSRPCGQGRKACERGGSRQRHRPLPKGAGSTWAPISPAILEQHPRIAHGLGAASVTGAALQQRLPPAPCYQVLSPASLQDVVERMAPRGLDPQQGLRAVETLGEASPATPKMSLCQKSHSLAQEDAG